MKYNKQFKPVRRIYLYVLVLLIIVSVGVFFSLHEKKQNQQRNTFHITFPPKRITTPTQLPTAQGTAGLLFSDNFANNSKGWSVANVSGYTRVLEDGTLTLSDTIHTVLVESVPTTTVFTNFSLTTTFALERGDENDSVGFYLRGDSNLDHDYRIEFFGNNTYAISKEVLSTNNTIVQTYLVPPTPTPLLKPLGQTNVVYISMQGANISLEINGTAVHATTDLMYTHGQIALFVSNGPTSDSVIAEFHTIIIYDLPKEPQQ